ncbi:hypothetical protein DID88_000873 [Monilinia fructigena]|uniref:Uncharacterized protein n=1 Tax=Monilinia fructigena TaxID=38457 RepID=A0A395IYH1_9HELO|nr:hypothetical protein DID88_000873 [Monilinia fructigena]
MSEPNNLEQFAAPETPTSTFAPGDFADSIMPAVGSNTSELNHHIESETSGLHVNSSESNHYVQIYCYSPSDNTTARLIKFDEKSPLALEVQAGNDIILREVLTEAATLKSDTNIVTYQADSTTERKPTWKLQFQLPGPALGFVNYHTFKLPELRRNGCLSRFLGPGNQSSSIAVSPVPSSAVSTSSNATSRNDLAYSANRISSATFADLSQLNGEAILFSLVDVVEGTLQVLNAKHGGSFFDHVSQLAKGIGLENDADFMKHAKNVFIGGLSSSRYSRSKPILLITEELVSDFLSKSDTLQKFPREFIDTYVKEISKKILVKAQNPQDPAQSKSRNYTESHNTETGHLIDVTEVLKPVKLVSATNPVTAINHAAVIESVGTSNLVLGQERRTYSIMEMIQMRSGAKLSREREIASVDIIQTTASGLRIVAGKNQGPRLFNKTKLLRSKHQEQSSFVQAQSLVGSTNHTSSGGIDRQDYCNFAPSKAAEANRQGIKNGALASISVEHNIKRSSADVHHQSLSGNSNSVSSVAVQAQNSNVAKKSTTEAESELTIKVGSENKTNPLLLPTNIGLSTSKYATTEVVNQATVLHAAPSYEHSPHQTVKRQDSPSKPSVSSKSLRSNQLHDTFLWETLLLSKQIQPSIKVERPETPKKEPVSKVDIASKLEQVHEFKAVKEEEALVSVIENAEWTTVKKATKQIAKAIGSQNNNSGFDRRLPTGSRHVATGSEIEIIAKILSNIEVKTERDNNVITEVLPAPERSTSPTIEEILEKKRANGLATSKWAGPQTTVFKPARHTPVLTSADNSQSDSNKSQYKSTFYPQNSQYNPAIQAQALYGDFSPAWEPVLYSARTNLS